jgi:hypothetical protein
LNNRRQNLAAKFLRFLFFVFLAQPSRDNGAVLIRKSGNIAARRHGVRPDGL